MRITNNLIQLTSLANIQRSLAGMHTAHERVVSGLRIQKASDDPIGAMESMRARGSLRALDQYRRGIQTATMQGNAEEQVLDQMTGLLIRAREVATLYGSDTADQEARKTGQIEVEGLLRHAIALGNTRMDGSFIFGGTDGATQPFDIDDSGPALAFTTTSPTGHRTVSISQYQQVVANHNGKEVFEDSGVLSALRDLGVALGSNDPEAIREIMSELDRGFDAIQGFLGEVGSRTSLLQLTSANLDALEVNLLTLKSEIEEVDIEKAMTDLVGRQTSFQAALLASSRIMSLNLADYLR